MMKALLVVNFDLETYLADVSVGCPDPPQGDMKRIGASNQNVGKISFKIKVVYQKNLIFLCVYLSVSF